jgi:phosphoglycerol transferase MdoB-like AlkP superfamily enzyme
VNLSEFWTWLNASRSFQFVKIVWNDLWQLTVVWVALYLFQGLTVLLPVKGFAGQLIDYIHQLGSVAVAALVVIFLIIDVVQNRRGK